MTPVAIWLGNCATFATGLTPLPRARAKCQLASLKRNRSGHAGWGLACLIIGAALALFLIPPSEPDLAAYKFTPISRQDATERRPIWSPDGKSIAFETNVHGIDQVFVKAIDSAEGTQITRGNSNCTTWSSGRVMDPLFLHFEQRTFFRPGFWGDS